MFWDNLPSWCLREPAEERVDWRNPTQRTLELKRLVALFACWGQGHYKANIQVKSQIDVKSGVNGSHAFLAKVYELCTANLSRHETPTPCSFLPSSPAPSPDPTSRIFNQSHFTSQGFPPAHPRTAKLLPPVWGMLIGHFWLTSVDGICFTCDIGSVWGPIRLCGQLFLMRHRELSWVFSFTSTSCVIQCIVWWRFFILFVLFLSLFFLYRPPDIR